MPSANLPLGNLNDRHRELLERTSGISAEVIHSRKYWTAESQAELQRLGFARPQCTMPALVIPLYGLSGSIIQYQIRLDRPRLVNGKPVSYETPKGSPTVIDVPPQARAVVLNPDKPLFVTASVRDADAAVSKGICCIALQGAWGWKNQGAFWEQVPLKGRQVYVAFGSDLLTNLSVQKATGRLKAFLEEKGAQVYVIPLTEREPGVRTSLDDFLAGGKTHDDVLRLAVAELPFTINDTRESGCVHGYRSTPDGLYRVEERNGEEFLFRLTNFPARITAEMLVSDGVDEHRELEVEATVDGTTRLACVRADEFAWMNWVLPALGPRAILSAGFDVKDHARAAIQYLSQDIQTVPVYGHLGWVVLEGRRHFLHAGGDLGAASAVGGALSGPTQDEPKLQAQPTFEPGGPKGPTPSQFERVNRMRVRVPEALTHFRLPAPPDGKRLIKAIRRSLRMLTLAPDHFIFPLYAAIWRPPLGNVGYGIFATGKTGTGKSESAALAQQHYGPGMDRQNLPGNWLSTANAIEITAFLAKDVLLVVDDWLPRGSRGEVEKAHREADRVLRAQGNHSGRGRCHRDGTPKGQKPPRGLIVATGEDVPDGLSLNARFLVLELREGDMNWERLSDCQRDAREGSYALVMAAYLTWLAPKYETIVAEMRERRLEFREGAKGVSLPSHLYRHPQTISIVADSLAGFEVYLDFAREAEAIDEEEYEALFKRHHDSLVELLKRQLRQQASNDPVEQFTGYLADALLSKQCHVTSLDDGPPDEWATAWGWVERLVRVPRAKQMKEGESANHSPDDGKGSDPHEDEDLWDEHMDRSPRGPRIGWLCGDQLYLLLTASLKEAQRMANQCGQHLPLSPKSLGKRLHEKNLLCSTDPNRGKYVVRTNIKDGRPTVLHLNAGSIIRPEFRGPPWAESDWEGDPPEALLSDWEKQTGLVLDS